MQGDSNYFGVGPNRLMLDVTNHSIFNYHDLSGQYESDGNGKIDLKVLPHSPLYGHALIWD